MKQRMVLCVLALMISTAVFGRTVKIMTWNIFMIPPVIYKSCQCERATLISEFVKEKDADVIIFQEAFQKKPRNMIWEAIKSVYPYESGVTKGGFLKTHSGVWIVSKFPIERKQSITYKDKKGSDKFAKKGATLVELNIDGKKIQVIGTHVQSDEKYQDIRNLQFKQLIEQLANVYFDPAIPQFIGGDLNTNLYSKDYKDMLGILDVKDVKQDGEPYSWNGKEDDLGAKFFGTHQETLDFIFVRNPHQKLASVQSETIYLPKANKAVCKKGFVYLSDHYPVVANILLP